ncbi:hypothetical protein VN97_g11324 [Penicillium thymicola]|uniref:Uncharacterized protein n=1 Tax=Penicillium thymicola TaxID=293382 RepID=A0AAI9T7A6_PENTH|nr:hypothetical protein VN97_g11324 [Penicillium thymicola]
MDTVKVGESAHPNPATNSHEYRTPPTTLPKPCRELVLKLPRRPNKSQKDDDAKLSTRATAAKDALVDKKDEKSHDTKADVHKGKFIHLIPSWSVTYKFYRTS